MAGPEVHEGTHVEAASCSGDTDAIRRRLLRGLLGSSDMVEEWALTEFSASVPLQCHYCK